jgi:GTP-binding protein Era
MVESETGASAAHQCGVIAVMGRPNTGKSTLINRVVGQKISIITPKPQTTRHRIRGIRTRPGQQTVWVDTPGIHGGFGGRPLNRQLNRNAQGALDGVDLALVLTQLGQWTEDEDRILGWIRAVNVPWLLVINQVDRIRPKQRLLPELARLQDALPEATLVPLSARTGDNLEALEAELEARLPEGPALYPDDALTDRPVRFVAAELIREQLLMQLQQELPYGMAVEIEAFEETPRVTRIAAVIWIERAAHKAMVIGRGGARLKAIGQAARQGIETLLEQSVYLTLWVKVRDAWTQDPHALRAFGLEES